MAKTTQPYPTSKRGFEGIGPHDEGNDTPLDDIDRRLAKLQGNRGLDESGNSTIFTEKDMPRCVFNVEVQKEALDGKSDQEVYEFFRSSVSDLLMKNYLTLTGIVPPRASGEISGGCSTKDGGSCEIKGTIRF